MNTEVYTNLAVLDFIAKRLMIQMHYQN